MKEARVGIAPISGDSTGCCINDTQVPDKGLWPFHHSGRFMLRTCVLTNEVCWNCSSVPNGM